MKNQAFTLIELLVVVLIIGILTAIAVPQYQTAVLKTKYQQLIIYANAISKAEENYYLSNGMYTDDASELIINLPTLYQTYTDEQGQTKGRFKNKYMYCSLRLTGTGQCQVEGTLGYEYHFRQGPIFCYAIKKEHKKLCASLTNDTPSCHTTNGLCYYSF